MSFLRDAPFEASPNCKLALDIGKSIHYLHSQRPPVLLHNLVPAHVIVTQTATTPKDHIISYGVSALHEVGNAQEVQQCAPPSIEADMHAFSCILLLLFAQVPAPVEMDSAICTMKQHFSNAHIELIRACFHSKLAKRPVLLRIVRFLEANGA